MQGGLERSLFAEGFKAIATNRELNDRQIIQISGESGGAVVKC
jgi:hypothetical protein